MSAAALDEARQVLADVISGIVDLVYPTRCVACDELGDEWICSACLAELIIPIPPPYCIRCGQAQPGAECYKCSDYPENLIRCRAVSVYDGTLAHLIHLLKYRDSPMLARPLASSMAQFLRIRAEIFNELRFDAIVPVPLHWHRQMKRGYNQSHRLAKELSKELAIPLSNNSVKRTFSTRPQVGKHRIERTKNLVGAFQASTAKCAGKTLLLLDDVSTTGSTLSECSKALAAAGAKKIYAITLAAG